MDAALPNDDVLLDRFQRAAFGYFEQHANPANGLVPDRGGRLSPCSIAAVGFALASYPVAVERGWMKREDAANRTLAAMRFFWNAPQNASPSATGYKGFFYHFLDMDSGERVWNCELSMIDTALLLAGILACAVYFSNTSPGETEIRDLSLAIYNRVDWVWAQGDQLTIRQGWKPECGFLHYGWEGYNEGTILYLLALASPTYPIAQESFAAWTLTYQWENIYGHDFLYAGPLFIHLFSHLWVDFRGVRDSFMREKNSDYFENSRQAFFVQREYARRNPLEFTGYGENCWGLTAGDGPIGTVLTITGQPRRGLAYSARGIPYGPDDGTLAPWAPIAALPFAPDLAWPALRHLMANYSTVIDQDRFASGYNPSMSGSPWVSDGFLGLDQGVIVLTIENCRSQFVWNLMRQCPFIRTGLVRAGFQGGWL